jgi:hypothetical protein
MSNFHPRIVPAVDEGIPTVPPAPPLLVICAVLITPDNFLACPSMRAAVS